MARGTGCARSRALQASRNAFPGGNAAFRTLFSFPVLQRRFATGRGALRAILAGYLSMEPERLKFGYTAYGKPFLLNSPANIQFNLSHSGGPSWWQRFAGTGPSGWTLKNTILDSTRWKSQRRFFCEQEKAEIAGQDGEARLEAFFQLWTAKEAFLKATSLGLALELSKFEIGLRPLRMLALEDAAKIHGGRWNLVAFRPRKDYSGAVAVAGQPLRLDYRDFLPPSDLP